MMLLVRTHLAIFRTVPDSREQVAAELRTIAEENVSLLDEGDQYIKPQDTIEWDAANKLETALVQTAWTGHSHWQIGRTTELMSAHENGRTLQGPAL